MKFIEMSRFKVLLTGCVLLLTLNCYQLYGTDFEVSYDPQSKTVIAKRTTDKSKHQAHTLTVQLFGALEQNSWAIAADVFSTASDIPLGYCIGKDKLYFVCSSAQYNSLLSLVGFLDKIKQNDPPGKMKSFHSHPI